MTTDTPRTEAEVAAEGQEMFYSGQIPSEPVSADFARTLERELNAAQALLYRMGRHIRDSYKNPNHTNDIRQGLDLLTDLCLMDVDRFEREVREVGTEAEPKP